MKTWPCLFYDSSRTGKVPAASVVILLLLLFYSFHNSSIAQTINFEDGFEDGNFSENPTWSGDTADFAIIDRLANLQLQLQGDSEAGGVSYLSVPSENAVGIWEFFIKLDGFSPSGGNRAEIFLMSDLSDLEGAVNGYALQAGENGSNDVFRIIRYDNGTEAAVVLSGTTDISAGGEFRVRINRQNGGIWTLTVADSYGGNPVQEGGSQIDNTYTGTAFFGLKVIYSSTRYNRFFFDFKIDLPPFRVENASFNNNNLDIRFNRNYNPATVLPSDFSLNNGAGTPASLSFPTSTTVRLSYPIRIPSNRYILTVNNIEDENGESIALNTQIEIIAYGLSEYGDVVINEFMYDPPIGLPEYVELKNRSSKFLNLFGWRIGDQSGTGSIAADTLTLEPDSLIVISSDTTALFDMFGTKNYVRVSSGSFPSLNNGGDAVRILSSTYVVLDSLYYFPEWGGENTALERRSAEAPSSRKANWGNSPQGIGTPGSSNLIEADLNPPEFIALQVQNPNTLKLLFDEGLDPQSATDANNYSIQPNAGIQLISAIDDTVLIYLSHELQSLQSYRISVSGLKDIFGNVMAEESREITFVNYSPVKPQDIVVNEILYIPADDGGPEFIELFNTTANNFDLSGWIIGDATSTTKLPPGTKLLAGQYLVLTDKSTFANTLRNGLFITGFPSLNNSGDAVFLRTHLQTTIDSLSYSSSWGGDQPGQSLERLDPLAASGDPSNWITGITTVGHTAEAQNSVYQPDEMGPSIIFAKQLSDNLIQAQFNEFVKITADLTFLLDNSPLSIHEFNAGQANRIVLKTSPAKNRSISTGLRAENLSDIKGNLSGPLEIPVSRVAQTGDLVINEIMYNPLENDDDNLSDQSEYIELRNTRDFAISIEGISVNDAPDENGEVNTLIPVSTDYKWIPANGLALVYADEEPGFEQSKLARFFDLPAHISSTALRINRTSLSLGSTGDAIFLTDSEGVTIDSVFYDDSWQSPNLLDTRGIALERISPFGPGGDASNWSSSATPRGGTPGAENSIYQISDELPEQIGISFSPNPFSPDDDGRDDILFINYKLDEPDYLLNVDIYDRYGRPIRKLANSMQGSFEGSLLWDGRKDDGSSNRIGIYIVVFEAFNSASGRNRAFKETVVLARRLQ